MKIIFISNYFTHHQKPLSDALSVLTQGDYIFLATEKMSDDRKRLGWAIDSPDYVHELDMSDGKEVARYIQIINQADAVIQGHLYDQLIEERVRQGKLTFIYNERLYKSAKRYLKVPQYLYKGFKYKSCYILAASAYTPYDYSLTYSYLNRCYKFGYFPETKNYSDVTSLFQKKNSIQILWVARFIDWKHPEIPIQIAQHLKAEGVPFRMKLIGTGYMENDIRREVRTSGLDHDVAITGAMQPEQVRIEMERAGIFLFTSDRDEGWGAVLNEAMNSGCAVVASHEIGAVPYLIEDGKTGLIYKDGDINDLYAKTKRLLANPSLQHELGDYALQTIQNTWNAQKAAENLIMLINHFLKGTDIPDFGPCSKADIIKDNWYKCQ